MIIRISYEHDFGYFGYFLILSVLKTSYNNSNLSREYFYYQKGLMLIHNNYISADIKSE